MQFAPRPLEPGEPQRMLEKARGKPRDCATLILLWRAGLRRSEACDLDTGDLEELEGGTMRVHVRNGKGGKARFVGLDKRSADYLRGWLEKRPGELGGPLLITSKGNRVHSNQVWRIVRRLASAAGIRRRIHPHAFRHTFARELYDEGIGVRHLQELLGHSSLQTTQGYLTSIGCSEAVEVTARREW